MNFVEKTADSIPAFSEVGIQSFKIFICFFWGFHVTGSEGPFFVSDKITIRQFP